MLFTTYGYSVIVAQDGYDALKILCSQTVDAVLLDYEMPGLRGNEVAAEIKRRNPNLPVLIVTGCQSVVEHVRSFADAAMIKGAPIAQLLDRIESMIGRATPKAAAARLYRQYLPLGSALATVAVTAAIISRTWK